MSTRSEIQFEDNYRGNNGKTFTTKARIYRHSDGYPEGVVTDLYEFVKKYGVGDVEYSAANFIYYEKAKMAKQYGEDSASYGYGVETPQKKWSTPEHGDIEYIYRLDFSDNKSMLEIYGVYSKKVLFKGTLDEAYEKYKPRMRA